MGTNLGDLALESGDPVAHQPAVQLDLALAGAAPRADPADLPLEVAPGSTQARQQVLEPRQLDLETGFAGLGTLAEDLDDQARTVEDRTVDPPLQVALLDRAE